jgi:diadenosine tetraphosphatase ApaH/serine/threonine PP2A family protein phosphatase
MVESGRLFAIGDIHGCLDELARLLDAIPAGAGDTVVFVGDYIDRGPDSHGVIEHLLEWRTRSPARSVFLKGNHEDMALGFLGRGGQWGEAWLRNGGVAALRSYGLDPHGSRADVAQRMPDAHVQFMSELETSLLWRDVRVVHAGIRPGVPWEQQRTEDLLWIREEFLDHPHDLGVIVVFGHTPHRRVVHQPPYRIGIDTGCVYGGALTCLMLPEGELYEVRLGDTAVRHHSLAGGTRRRA